MGRQIQFHALPEDMQLLLEQIQRHDPVAVSLKSADSPCIQPIADAAHEEEVMALWNKNLIQSLQRKLIRRPKGVSYYRVDDSLPTLDLSPCKTSDWAGRPALLQGRVYGFFADDSKGLLEWYKSIASWIRANFVRSPLHLLGGYLGPSAYRWFQDGGILLPMFKPPTTVEWQSFIDAQHPTTGAK